MNLVESSGQYPCEKLCTEYIKFISEEESSASYKSYYVENSFLSILENTNILSGGTTGLVSWAAAFCLAEWSLQNKDKLASKSVVELGCGCGFTGLSICKNIQNISKYMFTDCNSDVIKHVNHNLKINEIYQDCVSTSLLNWGDESTYVDKNDCDVILGADITFDKEAIKLLVNTLKHYLLKDSTKVAYIASTIRNEETYKTFIKLLEMADLKQSELRTTNIIPFVFTASIEGDIKIIKITSTT